LRRDVVPNSGASSGTSSGAFLYALRRGGGSGRDCIDGQHRLLAFLYVLRREVVRNPPSKQESTCGGFYTPFGVRCGSEPATCAQLVDLRSFYTPFGVRWFRTVAIGYGVWRLRRRFLYALRREVVPNKGSALTGETF